MGAFSRLALASTGAIAGIVACRSPSPSAVDAGPAVVAAEDRGPARPPPPLRAPHLAAPQLPDLPALADHEPPATPPPDTDLGGHPCRAVWTGADVAPLACARSLLFGSTGDGGATTLVPRQLLGRDTGQLPAVVDHRRDATEGPVRNQGQAPACTAFAIATAIDHAVARWGGQQGAVSVMQVWSRYHSPYVATSLSSNVGQAMGAEAEWPFSAVEATEWVPCSDYTKPPRVGCGKTVDDAHALRLAGHPLATFTEVEFLGAPETLALQGVIAAGQDVVVTLELPGAFVPKGHAGARYVPNYTKSAGDDAGHALVLAGYARLPHGTYFLAHNSWGPGWGDDGYAWIHETTLGHWVRQAVMVDAEPSERAPGSRPPRARGETTCAAELVPDSIRGVCAPACPDHSPRHDGVCAIAGQCPAGYVNLTGACVLAAPTAAGSDPDSRISWTCGPGGCSYVMPRASDPTCSGATCMTSCPAPDFRVARMGNVLVCVE